MVKISKTYIPKEKEKYMCAKHLAFFKQKLTSWKTELVKANNEALYNSSLDDNSTSADIVDQASSYTEKNVEMRAINRQIKLISKIDSALKRIKDGTYGFCEDTGEPIGLKRLIARPVATLTIAAQEKLWFKDPTARYSEDCSETSVEFPELKNDISIFPNPARNYISLSFEFAEPQSVSISLNDLSGKTMLERNIYDVLLVYEMFEVSKLTSGVYFLSIESSGKSISRKVIVE